MADINIEENYFDHPKIRRLIARLGKGYEIVPIRIWCSAAKFYPSDGIFIGLTDEEFCGVCGIDYEEKVIKVLKDLKIIEMTDAGIKSHQWEEYQGHIISFKKRGKEAAEARWGKNGKPKQSESRSNLPDRL